MLFCMPAMISPRSSKNVMINERYMVLLLFKGLDGGHGFDKGLLNNMRITRDIEIFQKKVCERENL